MKLTTKQLKQIIKEELRSVLSEVEWFNSPDEDYPAEKYPVKSLKSGRVVVFDSKDSYGDPLSGDTHGRDSHMVKHYIEMAPANVNTALGKSLAKIKKYKGDVFIIDGSGAPELVTDRSSITLGDIVNTYDHINDKMIESGNLPVGIEREIYGKDMAPLIFEYEKILSNLMSNAVDVSDSKVKDINNLKNILQKQPIINVKATFMGKLKNYWFDTKTSDMVGAEGQVVATLMRRHNKAKNKPVSLMKGLKDFRSGSAMKLAPEYSILSQYIDSQYAQSQKPQPAKKKQKQQKKRATPAEFAKQKQKFMSPDKLKSVIMKSYGISDAEATKALTDAGIS